MTAESEQKHPLAKSASKRINVLHVQIRRRLVQRQNTALLRKLTSEVSGNLIFLVPELNLPIPPEPIGREWKLEPFDLHCIVLACPAADLPFA